VKAPAQVDVGASFESVLRIGKGKTADPRISLLAVGPHVAVGVDLGAALVLEAPLEEGPAEEASDVLGRINDVDSTTLVVDLVVDDRADQILDHVQVAGVDDASGFDLALGVNLDRKQLVGVRLADVARRIGNRAPEGSQSAGTGARGHLVHEDATAVVKVIFSYAQSLFLDPSVDVVGRERCWMPPLRAAESVRL
jgi:hypothetical protein